MTLRKVSCIFYWGLEHQNRKKVKQQVSDNCIGSFAYGVCSHSGQYFVNVFVINNFFISNIAFHYKGTHIITLENKKINSENQKKTAMFNQISCILCSKKIKHTVTSASSFSRTSRVHHLVISKLEVEKYKIFKNINKTYSTDL